MQANEVSPVPDSAVFGGFNIEVASTAAVAPEPGAAENERAQGEQLFLEHLDTIQNVLATVARQHRLSPEDAEEFASTALLRMVSDGYVVLRKFRGQSKLRTFLTVVIQRMYLDFRAAQWGKWRPCADSRRGGDAAMLLERLTIRDGLTFDEACRVLEINHKLTIERDTLRRLYSRLRARTRPRFVNDEILHEAAVPTEPPDTSLADNDRDAVMVRALTALRDALAQMTSRERLLLKLRFADDMSVANIARLLDLDQKKLYRSFDRVLRRLREQLGCAGVAAVDVLPTLGHADYMTVDVFGLQ